MPTAPNFIILPGRLIHPITTSTASNPSGGVKRQGRNSMAPLGVRPVAASAASTCRNVLSSSHKARHLLAVPRGSHKQWASASARSNACACAAVRGWVRLSNATQTAVLDGGPCQACACMQTVEEPRQQHRAIGQTRRGFQQGGLQGKALTVLEGALLCSCGPRSVSHSVRQATPPTCLFATLPHPTADHDTGPMRRLIEKRGKPGG